MTDSPTIERRTSRRHRAKHGMGEFVTDQELIEFLGLPSDLGRKRLAALDGNPQSNFPRKQPFWGDRRYLPAVQQWLDRANGLKIEAPQAAPMRAAPKRRAL